MYDYTNFIRYTDGNWEPEEQFQWKAWYKMFGRDSRRRNAWENEIEQRVNVLEAKGTVENFRQATDYPRAWRMSKYMQHRATVEKMSTTALATNIDGRAWDLGMDNARERPAWDAALLYEASRRLRDAQLEDIQRNGT